MTTSTTTHRRRLAAIPLLVVALAAAACTEVPPEPSPPGTASPSVPAVTPTPPPSATADPTVAPASPTPVPTTAEACAIETQTGRLPSDRMTDVVISSTEGADLVTFVFGDPSLPTPPQGPSEGLLELAEPPYVEGASGLPMDIDGERVLFLRFSGMSIVNDVGELTYDGPDAFRPDTPALRTVANSEQFEGVVSWYIGFDGPGCVELASDARSVTVSIAVPPG